MAVVGLAAPLANAGGVYQPQPAGSKPVAPPEPSIIIDLRDEVSLPQLIDFVRRAEGIQVIYAEDLSDKKVYFPAPISIPASRLLNFLIQVLEQKGYTLVHNQPINVYNIVPIANNQLTPIIGGQFASTQIVDTKGIKPTALQGFVNIIGGFTNAVYADDLGVMVVTDSPNKIDLLRQYIDRLIAVRDEVQYVPLEVKNISATAARDRVLALAGESSGNQAGPFGVPSGVPQPGKQATPTPNVGAASSVSSTVTSNLSFQLSVDPQSNSLFFRGRADELVYVQRLLELVDVPNRMRSIFYEVGVRASEVIAFQGSREGLGDVATYQSASEESSGIAGLNQPRPGVPQQQQQVPGQQGNQNQASNAAGFVIYPEAGGFMYHGTPEQHARISVLAKDLEKLSQGDLMTMEFYKLKHAKAEDVVSILGSLLGDDGGSANTGSIVGNDLSRGNQDRRRNSRDRSTSGAGTDQRDRSDRSSSASSGMGGAVGNEETSIIDDYKNNQVIVKTRQRLQPEFAKLIQRLDARRPQVYVNAQIVAVTDNENTRLAVETQILAGQFGLNTNFGLGSFGTGGDFFSGKNVATGLPGFTAAVVRSDFVPFIITALQNNTDSRILATPQLLVDDNESASVLSENEVPTAVTQIPDSGPPIQSVGDSSRAGTSLDITPQISENAVKLNVYIEQSAFTGEATATLPPPVQRNVLESQVTVPRDCTIVIGGLQLDSDTKTVVKVPILGDIPLAGLLFRDTVTRKTRTKLYIFLTPTIMTDPTFADLRLLTKGPAAEVKLKSDHILPGPSLVPMEIGRPLQPTPPLPEPDERPVEPAPSPAVPASPAAIGRPGESTGPVEKRIQP